MRNNEKQQETLQAFTNHIDEGNAYILKNYTGNPDFVPPKEDQEKHKQQHINCMTDMVFHNPLVFLQMTSAAEDAEPYRHEHDNEKKYPTLVMYTDKAKLEAEAFYKEVPFLEICHLLIDNPELLGIMVNPTEKMRYYLTKDTLEFFLNFENVEFIGF